MLALTVGILVAAGTVLGLVWDWYRHPMSEPVRTTADSAAMPGAGAGQPAMRGPAELPSGLAGRARPAPGSGS